MSGYTLMIIYITYKCQIWWDEKCEILDGMCNVTIYIMISPRRTAISICLLSIVGIHPFTPINTFSLLTKTNDYHFQRKRKKTIIFQIFLSLHSKLAFLFTLYTTQVCTNSIQLPNWYNLTQEGQFSNYVCY